MTGSTSWQQSGKEEHALGEAEYDAAQAKGYAEGLTDRVGGYKDSVVGAVKGDEAQQVAGKSDCYYAFIPCLSSSIRSFHRHSGNVRKEKGKGQQEVNKP
jgi:uncharacterized protein YjbJ (UPF0337 family)